MPVKFLRIIARCEDDLDYPIYIDAPVDQAGMINTKGWLFGCVGKSLGDRLNLSSVALTEMSRHLASRSCSTSALTFPTPTGSIGRT